MQLAPTSRWTTPTIEFFLLEPSDVEATYVSWLNDPLVGRYLESRFATHTLDSTRHFVQTCRQSDRALFLGIRSRLLDLRHVGNIKIEPIDRRHGLGEVGILIGDRAAWGKGLASDSIRALAMIAREELSLRKLTAGCYASNIGSQKAFLRAGFEVEGRRPGHFLLDGKPEDLVLMAKVL